MREFIDFSVSALPWIAIGLFIAMSCIQAKAMAEGKELGRAFNCAAWFPAVIFFVLGILDMKDGNKSSGTTWLILGIINIILKFANTEKDDE